MKLLLALIICPLAALCCAIIWAGAMYLKLLIVLGNELREKCRSFS